MLFQVSAPSFLDYDLDEGELAGTLQWQAPEVTTTVTGYRIYLAEDANGTNRSVLGEQARGTNSLTVPVNTDLKRLEDMKSFAFFSNEELRLFPHPLLVHLD